MENNQNEDLNKEHFHYSEKLDSIDFLHYASDDAVLDQLERGCDMVASTIRWLRRNARDSFLDRFGKRILGVTNYFSKMFKRQGVSREEVFQTVCLLSLKINEECSDERWLAFRMKRRLPQYVWREMKLLLPQCRGVNAEEILARVPERQTKRWVQMLEADDMLERALSGSDLHIARALLTNKTQEEIAAELDLSQPTISLRIRVIREKLRTVFLGPDQSDPNDRDVPPYAPDTFDIEEA